MDIKLKLFMLHKTQVNLIFALRERGFNVSPPDLSRYIGGSINSPKANVVIDEVNKIIGEWEVKK